MISRKGESMIDALGDRRVAAAIRSIEEAMYRLGWNFPRQLRVWVGGFDPAARLESRRYIVGSTYRLPIDWMDEIRALARSGELLARVDLGEQEVILSQSGSVCELLNFAVYPPVLALAHGPLSQDERRLVETALAGPASRLSEAIEEYLDHHHLNNGRSIA